MNWLILMMESFSTVFFLFSMGLTSYVYMTDKKNTLAAALTLAFALLYFSTFSLLMYDAGIKSETLKIISTTLEVLSGLVFMYIFIREELVYRTMLKLRGAV